MKGVLGVIIALLLGFVLFLFLTGVGFLFGLVLKTVPVWYIIMGTIICTLFILLRMVGRDEPHEGHSKKG